MTDLRKKAEEISIMCVGAMAACVYPIGEKKAADPPDWKAAGKSFEDYIETALLEARREALKEAAEVARFYSFSPNGDISRATKAITKNIEKLMEPAHTEESIDGMPKRWHGEKM